MSTSPGLSGHPPGRFARLAGVLTASFGFLILLAWGLVYWTGEPAPTSSFIWFFQAPGGLLQGSLGSWGYSLAVGPLEALAFVLLGLSVSLQTRGEPENPDDSPRVRKPWLPFVLSALAGAIGAAVLLRAPGFEGSMHLATAIGLLLTSLIATFPDYSPWRNGRPLQLLAIVVLWAAFLSITSFAYGAFTANRISWLVLMPVPTALIFLLLVPGILFLRPRDGIAGAILDPHIGGTLARRLLPWVIMLPFIVGWMRIQGIRAGYFDNYFGYAQFATTNVLVFGLFIWISARVLNRMDRKRRRALETIQVGNNELKRLNASLEAKIRQHYVAEEARKKAEMQLFQSQKMEALGTLASGIAHDFNNILTIILLNADLPDEVLPKDHPARRNFEEISKAGNRAADLIRQIMTFGQHSGSELKTLRIEKVVNEAADILHRSLPQGIRVLTETGDSLPAVNANKTHIEQVLINLGTNAAQAMKDGAGTLRIRLDAVTITPEKTALTADLKPGDYVRINVSDDGHGMDAATVKNIFNPFFTTKAPGEGTGLGLSVVHGILKMHGGAVTVYSEPGRGTLFSLYFPATHRPVASEEPLSLGMLRGRGEKILCVDDDESLGAAVGVMLTHLGYRVTVHTSARAALADFKGHPGHYDLVVSDYSMPEMSGVALARALCAERPGLPIIMVSGFFKPDDVDDAKQAGIYEVLLKPDIPERIGEILHRLLAPNVSHRPA